jgi:hypothetical protein
MNPLFQVKKYIHIDKNICRVNYVGSYLLVSTYLFKRVIL